MTTIDQAIAWANLQEAINGGRPNRPNPNDNLKKLTKEERNARLYVKINKMMAEKNT